MKIITNNFKEQISKLGREIDFKFFLHTNDKIITEDGNFLMTQSNQHLIVEQFDDEEVDEIINANEINNVSIINCGKLLSTMMKEIDFEIKRDLRIGDVIGCQFGLKVNGEYEYVDYGKYMVYSKEYNEDTKSYSYVAFDRMLLTMKEVTDTTIFENRSVLIAIQNICSISGLQLYTDGKLHDDYPNLNNIINEGTFTDLKLTYRDILDMICQVLGVSMIVENKYLKLKPLNNTIVDNFDERFLKDTNVSFGKHYGPINSIVLSRSEDNDNIYRKDDESIEKNGLCEFKIKDNPILLNDDRENYIEEIFEQLNGLDYYINDFSSTGITYLDWLDFYNVTVGDNTYKCLMLNDEIKISQGLEESIYTEEPEETVTDYKTSSKTDKEVSFIVDKQNSEIKSRVTKNEFESTIEQTNNKINAKVSQDDIIASLNIAVEDGQGIVELKGNTVIIQSDNCQLTSNGKLTVEDADVNGKITSSEGTIGGFTLSSISLSANVQDKYTYTLDDAQRVRDIIMGSITPTQQDYEKLDVNNDGLITALDYTGILRKYYGYASTSGTVILTTDDANKVLYFEGNGTVDKNTVLGIGHITTTTFTGNTFVTPQGETSIDSSGIVTPQVTQTSLEKNKKNFEKLNSGLEIIKNTDIYKYHLKTQNDNDKKHIGFVIGKNYKHSSEITSVNDENEEIGVDIYSMVSVCFKAIQEQQEQINSLKEEIKKLKEDK